MDINTNIGVFKQTQFDTHISFQHQSKMAQARGECLQSSKNTLFGEIGINNKKISTMIDYKMSPLIKDFSLLFSGCKKKYNVISKKS